MEYCLRSGVHAQQARRDEVARYVGDLCRRPSPKGGNVVALDSGVGLSNATMQQRLTAVRLFFYYLIEKTSDTKTLSAVAATHLARNLGASAIGDCFPASRNYLGFPATSSGWPSWTAARKETIRNRCMIPDWPNPDAALRRQEVCLSAVWRP